MRLILASASPRRKELLEVLNLDFEVMKTVQDENPQSVIPSEIVCELSRAKAVEIVERLDGSDDFIVIGADTVVAYEGITLMKPVDEDDAVRMLQRLQGNRHDVFTGVTIGIRKNKQTVYHTFFEKTQVCVYPMTEQQILSYIATKEPMDKAGAYGIQGMFMAYIKEIRGEYANVVGLPVSRLCRELQLLGFDLLVEGKSMAQKEGNMAVYDDAVIQCFLDNQLQLFPETVAETEDEAEDFLEDCMAYVAADAQEVWDYFDESGVDMEHMDKTEILKVAEVFEVGDGRYLIVEA